MVFPGTFNFPSCLVIFFIFDKDLDIFQLYKVVNIFGDFVNLLLPVNFLFI